MHYHDSSYDLTSSFHPFLSIVPFDLLLGGGQDCDISGVLEPNTKPDTRLEVFSLASTHYSMTHLLNFFVFGSHVCILL